MKTLALFAVLALAPVAQAQISQSQTVLAALQKNDLKSVAAFVGREKLRFSPSIFAHKSDLQFSRQQLSFLSHSPKKWRWGDYDGSGEPIVLTWRDYLKGFVWTRDFSNSKFVNLNQFTARGNTPNNLRTFYKGATFVEFYLPPTSKDGLDWATLWMVWRKTVGKWVLVGIAHDSWTI